MISKYGLFQITLRVTLIMGNCFLLGFLFFNSENYVIIVHLFLLVLFQTWLLSRFLNKTNKRVHDLLESYINNEQVKIKKMEKQDTYSKGIHSMLEKLNSKVRNAEAKLIKQLSYNKVVMDNIPSGLITVKDELIELCSNSVHVLLGKRSIQKTTDFSNYPELKRVIENIKPGEKQIARIIVGNSVKVLSLSCSEIKSENETTRIISFENIKPELDEQEIESYQKLIRVLTHEMMNTISPIISANETLKHLLKNMEFTEGKEIAEIDLMKMEKLEKGIQLINDRTKGISLFIEKYRKLTKLPKPDLKKVSVSALFDELIALHETEIRKLGISCISEMEPDNIQLYVDRNLVMQVLINLFKNSIEALRNTNKPQIVLRSYLNNDNRIVVCISDNGCGIANDDLNEIFIPFFTTKKEGSGIGLSLSKQIMHLHKGDILLNCTDLETEFCLLF